MFQNKFYFTRNCKELAGCHKSIQLIFKWSWCIKDFGFAFFALLFNFITLLLLLLLKSYVGTFAHLAFQAKQVLLPCVRYNQPTIHRQ